MSAVTRYPGHSKPYLCPLAGLPCQLAVQEIHYIFQLLEAALKKEVPILD